MSEGRWNERSVSGGGGRVRYALRACALFVVVVTAAACIEGEAEREHVVAGGDVARGAALINTYGCGACHVIPGVEGANGTVGPPLTDWAERRYIAGALPNTAPNLVAWIMQPQAVEPGTAMPNMGVTPAEARDIAAYLYTLGDPTALGPPHLFPARVLEPGGRNRGATGRSRKRDDTGQSAKGGSERQSGAKP